MRNYNRLLVLLSLLACLISPVYAGGLRNVANNSTRHLSNSQVCNIQIADVQFEDGQEREEYKCLVDGDWNGYNDGIDDHSYSLPDMDPAFLQANDDAIREGNFFVAIPGGKIVDNGVDPPFCTVPNPSAVTVIKGLRGRDTRRRNLAVTGENSVLVVRVRTTYGDQVSVSGNALAGSIFGLGNDPNKPAHTMTSQYQACSGGRLRFRPVTSTLNGVVVNGVVDVTINKRVQGVDIFSLTNAMNQAAIDTVGNSLSGTPRHVMYCAPPGTTFNGSKRWVAFAYVNGISSYYNDAWCDKLSAQVHEVGHNLGMHHSNEDGGEYGDQSGMMGFSYFQRGGPLMCFNAFKHYKLGWFNGKTKDIYGDWTGKLAAFTDATLTSDPVILKIGSNVYAQLNRATGMNAGTREKKNEVVLVQGTELRQQSSVLAGLSSGQKYSLPGGKTFEVCDIDFSGIVDYARVSIYSSGSSSGCRVTYSGGGGGGACLDDFSQNFVLEGVVRNCQYVASRAQYFRVRGNAYWENYSSFCGGNARNICRQSCQTCP